MPLPAVYSPTLQPSAWWTGAQSQISGLPDLPAGGAPGGDMSQFWQSLEPYRPKLMDLYQQSLANPAVGTTPGDGGVPTSTLPTEAGSTALGQLLASFAGASRYGTSPLAGLPSQVGETSYSYSTTPQAPAGGGGVIEGTLNPISPADLAAMNAPAPLPEGSQTMTGTGQKGAGLPVGAESTVGGENLNPEASRLFAGMNYAPLPPDQSGTVIGPTGAPIGTGIPTTGAIGGDPGYAVPGSSPTPPANPVEGQTWTGGTGLVYVFQNGQWVPQW